MKPSTGRWVSGDDFFDREADLGNLKRLVRDRNHVLLTGQRRMGKTSVVRELGRQLEAEGWLFLFADVEGAACPEDAVARIAQAAHPVHPIGRRLAGRMKGWLDGKTGELSAGGFRISVGNAVNAGSWRHHGERLLRDCAAQDGRALLAIDELPIFLKRMFSRDGDAKRVEEFLSWLRGTLQTLGDGAPVVVVSGSVGLEPLVRRLRIPDRINYFHPYLLRPWDRDTSIGCFERLAESNGLSVENGVPEAVYEALGIGIPHQVQYFFAHLRSFAARRERVTVEDVGDVYRTELLRRQGKSDLAHYETRLEEALEEKTYAIAMDILVEAAVGDVFTPAARRRLEAACDPIVEDARERIVEAMDVLEHDGYLEAGEDGHRFASRLLKDWWAARFRGHYTPLDAREPAR